MSASILFALLLSVSLSAIGQILMKLGMSNAGIREAIARDSGAAVMQIATSVPVVAGLTAYGLSTMVWLYVLAQVDVSLAYPFVALGFVLVVLLSSVLLGEQVPPVRIAGLLLIVSGVVLVSRS